MADGARVGGRRRKRRGPERAEGCCGLVSQSVGLLLPDPGNWVKQAYASPLSHGRQEANQQGAQGLRSLAGCCWLPSLCCCSLFSLSRLLCVAIWTYVANTTFTYPTRDQARAHARRRARARTPTHTHTHAPRTQTQTETHKCIHRHTKTY